jgi:phenylacetate-coenzyme A ligase PaaK-like adenylate-forming protein
MTSSLESIYFHSPIWAQQLMVSTYGWYWYRRRYGTNFHRLVSEFRQRDGWNSGQFRAYQEEQLAQLFQTALHSSYYKKVLTDADYDPSQSAFMNLEKLPLLDKETLRTRSRELLTQTRSPKGTIIFRSSGTTGTPTEIYYTPEFHALELAAPAVRNLGWAGIDYQARRVMFGVRKVCRFDQHKPPFWRFSPSENMAYASIYHLSPELLPFYIDFLNSYHPAVIMGYPSALNTIARYALETGKLPAPAVGVFTTSETVTSQIREAVEGAWQCKISDRYGAVENCIFASQCEYGRMHISPEVGIVEILDKNGHPAPSGKMGEVVCTGLHNMLQPLIRYRIGDVARWAIDQNCPCGRQMPILEAIDGRYEDICITPDGRELLRFDTVFKGVDTIREAQVVQERSDSFAINIVPASGFNASDIEQIKANMCQHVGKVTIQVRTLPMIPRTASGKFRAVISKLTPDQKGKILSECKTLT